jgi:iron complex transport system substrate-binding protein
MSKKLGPLVAGVVAVFALTLAACGGGEEAGAPAAEPAEEAVAAPTAAEAQTVEGATGPWSFTDDRGVEVTLERPPERIVAQEDAAAALWPFGIRPVGVFGNAPLGENPQLEGEDLSGVESVGEVFGEINLEKLAALDPDLIVVPTWPPYGASGMGFKDDQQLETVAQIAPIVAVNVRTPYTSMLDRFADLAQALGANVESPDVVAVREELDTALQELRAAIEAKPGLRVMAVSANPDQLYVADPGGYSDLQLYQALGLDVVVPTTNLQYGWEELSWERADKYPADVILYDGRAGTLSPEQLAQQPTWKALPAVEAEQIGPWYVGTTYSVPFFTEHVKELTALLERSQDIVE